jgi:hypothetical protein
VLRLPWLTLVVLLLATCGACSPLMQGGPFGPPGSQLPPRASATSTASIHITPRPSPAPRHSTRPIATSAPSASPSPTPPAAPAAIRFKGVGFDSPDATTPTERSLTFRSDAPGTVTVTLGRTSAGRVRICLWQGDGPHRPGDCRTTSGGSLHQPAAASVTTWNVAIIGLDIQTQSIADIRLEYPAAAPSVAFGGFRFQGVANPGANGIDAVFNASSGPISVDASWNGSRPWRSVLNKAGTTLVDKTGRGSDLHLAARTSGGKTGVELTETEDYTSQEVFISGTIAWP